MDDDMDRGAEALYENDLHVGATPSAAAMVMAISRSSSDAIYRRTGMTPMAPPSDDPSTVPSARAACSSDSLPPVNEDE